MAKNSVKVKATKVCFFALAKIAWWAHVTVAPDVNKIKVFVKGTVYVFITVIALGGQTPPILCTGEMLEWKKAQKKSKKKHNFWCDK